MTNDPEDLCPHPTPDEIRLKAVQVLSFSQFVDSTRLYEASIIKSAPDAASWIQSAAAPWHESWHAVLFPNGTYVGPDQATALRQFDALTHFGAEVCDSIHLFYSKSDVAAIKASFEKGVRKDRRVYLQRYSQLERSFAQLDDAVTDVLLEGMTSVISNLSSRAEVHRIINLHRRHHE